ncbi:hypothetical protein LTR36_001820 [Oleoguttula mirabilis]|uniref:Uncharacterized protein n=1 Tax=Oleoguttula mirabilis TaxID=1507867 RepID=A0AAV9JM49_9PEZI|nr:hypothetical protein LTR36_001820 [Oleoguttula mirabilis]
MEKRELLKKIEEELGADFLRRLVHKSHRPYIRKQARIDDRQTVGDVVENLALKAQRIEPIEWDYALIQACYRFGMKGKDIAEVLVADVGYAMQEAMTESLSALSAQGTAASSDAVPPRQQSDVLCLWYQPRTAHLPNKRVKAGLDVLALAPTTNRRASLLHTADRGSNSVNDWENMLRNGDIRTANINVAYAPSVKSEGSVQPRTSPSTVAADVDAISRPSAGNDSGGTLTVARQGRPLNNGVQKPAVSAPSLSPDRELCPTFVVDTTFKSSDMQQIDDHVTAWSKWAARRDADDQRMSQMDPIDIDESLTTAAGPVVANGVDRVALTLNKPQRTRKRVDGAPSGPCAAKGLQLVGLHDVQHPSDTVQHGFPVRGVFAKYHLPGMPAVPSRAMPRPFSFGHGLDSTEPLQFEPHVPRPTPSRKRSLPAGLREGVSPLCHKRRILVAGADYRALEYGPVLARMLDEKLAADIERGVQRAHTERKWLVEPKQDWRKSIVRDHGGPLSAREYCDLEGRDRWYLNGISQTFHRIVAASTGEPSRCSPDFECDIEKYIRTGRPSAAWREEAWKNELRMLQKAPAPRIKIELPTCSP